MQDTDYYLIFPDADRNDLASASEIDVGDFDWKLLTYGKQIDDYELPKISIRLDNGDEGDVVGNKYSWLIVSNRIRLILNEVLADSVQWIQVNSFNFNGVNTNKDYYIFHPIRICDVLVPSDKTPSIFRMVIRHSEVPQELMCFRLKNNESIIVFTGDCTRLLYGHGLQGLERFALKSI